MFGFGARTIAIIDTADDVALCELSMIPLLTLIAIYAPAGHRATWFALMASLMNLALVAGALQTKYLNLAVRGRSRLLCRSCGAHRRRGDDRLHRAGRRYSRFRQARHLIAARARLKRAGKFGNQHQTYAAWRNASAQGGLAMLAAPHGLA